MPISSFLFLSKKAERARRLGTPQEARTGIVDDKSWREAKKQDADSANAIQQTWVDKVVVHCAQRKHALTLEERIVKKM